MTIEIKITAESAEDLQAQLSAISLVSQAQVELSTDELVKSMQELQGMKEKAAQEKAKAKRKAEPKKEEKKAKDKPTADDKEDVENEETESKKGDKQPTIEDVREVMGKAVQNGEKDTIKELFQQFGASKLSELDPADYQEFVDGLEAVLST